jgi:hypothetical protein
MSGEPFYVLVWAGMPPSEHYLRTEDAQCIAAGCTAPGVIMDSEYDEPWCQRHADEYSGDEAISGPEIVRVDSARHKEILEDKYR